MTYRQLFATIAVDKYIELFTKFPIAVVGFAFLILRAHPGRTLVVISSLFVAFFLAMSLGLLLSLVELAQQVLRIS
jgi:hypothetical protein